MFAFLICFLLVAYCTWSLICLEINYHRAKRIGIPLVRLPIDPLNFLFVIFETHVWTVLDRLPLEWILPHWTIYARRGWFWNDKAKSSIRLGNLWALVTPVRVYVQLSDPEGINDVLSRRMDFQRPTEPYKILEVFGPCISTATSENWSRHRKVIAMPFNESIMSFVWSESVQQAQDLKSSWLKGGVSSYSKDTRTLSLNVLAATGFNKSFKFRPWRGDETQDNTELSYRDALQIILDNAILLLVLGPKLLTSHFLPVSWQRVGKAASAFQTYMQQMVDEEMHPSNQDKKGPSSLMASFIRSGNEYATSSDSANTRTKGLSVDEIFGNIFVINFAGHDTTANTLAFGVSLLAAHPDIQAWVAEEVRNHCQSASPESWQYKDLFPKLVRCHAVMYEILRLFPPVLVLQKTTRAVPQIIHTSDSAVTIPPNVQVFASVHATHYHPSYYKNPHQFEPARWIKKDGDMRDELIAPRKGAYLAWADGPQVCPGLKFSQVEFVAVLATMLQGCRIETVRLASEDDDMMKKRVMNVLNDCDLQLLLRMKDAEKVQLKFVRA